jgi:hypothetical protein
VLLDCLKFEQLTTQVVRDFEAVVDLFNAIFDVDERARLELLQVTDISLQVVLYFPTKTVLLSENLLINRL